MHDLSNWPPSPGNELGGQSKERSVNVLGGLALVVAMTGMIFACIEGVMIVGWFLLPLSVIFGVAALSKKGKRKVSALVGILAAVFGVIISYGVFSNLPVKSMDAAYGAFFNSEVEAGLPVRGTSESSTTDGEDAPEAGSTDENSKHSVADATRTHPVAIGETVGNHDWDVTVNSFNPNASADVAAENMFNDPPEPGHQYAVANLTFTYKGEDSRTVDIIPVAFVASNGNVARTFDKPAVAPEPRLEGELYAGGSASGNVVLHIQEGQPGVLRIELGLFGDEVFVAVP